VDFGEGEFADASLAAQRSKIRSFRDKDTLGYQA
jgi:hypothetical protein